MTKTLTEKSSCRYLQVQSKYILDINGKEKQCGDSKRKHIQRQCQLYCFEVINVLMHEALTPYSRDGVNIQLVRRKYHCQQVVLVAVA